MQSWEVKSHSKVHPDAGERPGGSLERATQLRIEQQGIGISEGLEEAFLGS